MNAYKNKRLIGHIIHLRSSALQETSFTKPTVTSVPKKKNSKQIYYM